MKIPIAIFSLLFTMNVKAQPVNFGIKGGVNVYHLTSYGYQYPSLTGFNAGILARLHIKRTLTLQPEICYSSEGYKFIDRSIIIKNILGYVNLSLLLQYLVAKGIMIEAGPQFGVLVNAKSKDNFGNTAGIKDDYTRNDFGGFVGLCYTHSLLRSGIDIRYYSGFTNLGKTYQNERSKGIQAGIFYLLKHR